MSNICPDCLINELTDRQYKDGKICRSCQKRKFWAERKGETYIKFKDLPKEEQEARLGDKKLAISKKKEHKRGGRAKYPDKVYEFIRSNVSKDKTARELHTELLEAMGDDIENIYTVNELTKYLVAMKLPYKRLTNEERQQLVIQSKQESHKDKVVENVEPIKKVEEENDRFAPIREEVENVLNQKFKEVGCELGYNFSVEDYLDAFTIVRYLLNNFQQILQKRNDQWDIANAYQVDVIHEMENQISEPGDTYFQDKTHVLRDIRRGYEIDRECVEAMKPFLVGLSKYKSDISELIERIQNVKGKKDEPKYVPNVDTTMIDKYDWATQTSPSKKLMQRTLLKTNSRRNEKAGLPIFVASCYISGGGYGTFKKWAKEVSYPTKEEAERAIKIELDDIKKKNRDILITNFSIYQKSA